MVDVCFVCFVVVSDLLDNVVFVALCFSLFVGWIWGIGEGFMDVVEVDVADGLVVGLGCDGVVVMRVKPDVAVEIISFSFVSDYGRVGVVCLESFIVVNGFFVLSWVLWVYGWLQWWAVPECGCVKGLGDV